MRDLSFSVCGIEVSFVRLRDLLLRLLCCWWCVVVVINMRLV